MKKVILTTVAAALLAPASMAIGQEERHAAASEGTGTLPTLQFVTRPQAPPYGKAPQDTTKIKKARKTPVRKVRPSSGTFIDEPNLPQMLAFNWSYPWTIMQLDAPEMTETHLLNAENWPVTIHLRNGNLEGTYFYDNPKGTTMLQASFQTNGLPNWSRRQFISNTEWGKRFVRTAYDERNDIMYGLGPSEPDKKEYFTLSCFYPDTRVDANGSEISPLTNIKVINDKLPAETECSAFAWDPRDGSLIGVSVAGKVIRFDPVKGTYKEIFDTGLVNSPYFGGLAYSPKDKGFIWAYLTRDEAGNTTGQDFYLIDTDRRKATLIKSVPHVEGEMVHQVSSLIINEHYADPYGPRVAEVTSDTFTPHSGDGTITLKMPTHSEKGLPIAGNLKYMVRVDGIRNVDGTPYAEATLAPGATRTETFSGLGDGVHRITFYTVTEDGHWSRPLNVVKYVGYDTPMPPANVVLTEENLTWEPVTEGVHGQDITDDGIEYEVWVNAEKIGTTSGTSYDMNFDKVELASHLAAVYAVNHGNTSEGAFSNRVAVGKYRTVPATFEPGASDVLLATVVDANEDGKSWEYYDYYKAWCATHSWSEPDNDWLFLPPVNFDDPEALYEISFDLQTNDYDETLELRLCEEAVADSGEVLLTKTINTRDYSKEFIKETTVTPASGIKHLCFHAKEQHADLFVRNVQVKKSGSTKAAPAAVTDLNVTSADKGQLSATATFTFPTKTVAGNTIPADADVKVEVSGVYKDFSVASASGKPGTQGTITFAPTEGLTDVFVQPSIGSEKGLLSQATFWCGEDVPGEVKNLKVALTADPMVVKVDWEAPGTVGFHGGYADPESMQYYLVAKKSGAEKWTRFDPQPECGLSLSLVDTYDQTLTQFGIMTENRKGTSQKWEPTDITCGKAYTLPMRENFVTGKPNYNPVVLQRPTEEYTGTGGYADPSQLKPEYEVPGNTVLGLMPPADGKAGKARVELPYFSTVGAKKPAIVFQALIDPDITAQADVYVRTYGKDPVKIGSWNASTPGKGYTSLAFKIPAALMGKKWVQCFIDATFEGGEDRRFVVVKRYSVTELQENDLSLLSVSTPDHMRINRDAKISAVVCNNSRTEKEAPKLTLKVADRTGRETVSTIEPDDKTPLGPDAERTYTFTLHPDADHLGTMHFSLSLPDDDVAANNVYEATGTVETGNAVICTTLNAARDSQDKSKVNLDWNEPVVFDGLEDMESMSAFDISTNLGSFINVDLDGSLTYTWENWDFPHEEEPHAFIVFDDRWKQIPSASAQVLRAHSGHQFLLALAPLNYVTANDWLISPEVEPGSDVSLWLKPVSTQYGADQVGIYYSKGGDTPDDFEMLSYHRITEGEWQEVKETLPADAKRFALRYYSNDTFGIMLDDISYTPLGGLGTLHGFELTRNGEVVKTFESPEYAFTDTGVDEMEQFYNVTPTLELGDGTIVRGEKSPTARVDGKTQGLETVAGDAVDVIVSGRSIIVMGAKAENICVSNAEGLTIPAAATTNDSATYRVEPGVYVVKAGGNALKVFVR